MFLYYVFYRLPWYKIFFDFLNKLVTTFISNLPLKQVKNADKFWYTELSKYKTRLKKPLKYSSETLKYMNFDENYLAFVITDIITH